MKGTILHLRCAGCRDRIEVKESDFDRVAHFAQTFGTTGKFFCEDCASIMRADRRTYPVMFQFKGKPAYMTARQILRNGICTACLHVPCICEQ